jgi:outer membrane protein
MHKSHTAQRQIITRGALTRTTLSTICSWLFLLQLSSLGLVVLAAEPNHADTSYDLLQIYDFAKAYDAEFQQNQLLLDAQAHNLASSSSGLKPSVTLTGDISHSETTTTGSAMSLFPSAEDGSQSGVSRVFALNVQQIIFDLEDINRHQQGETALSSLSAERRQLEQGFLQKVSTLFFDALLAQDDLYLAQRQAQTLAQQLSQAQERFEVGLVSVTDVLEAQAQLDNAKVDTLAAQNQLAITREDLLLLTGKSINTLKTLSTEYPIIRPKPELLADWINIAQTQSPALQIAEKSLEKAKLQHDLAQRAYLPSINLFGRYSTTEGYQSGFDQPDQKGSSVGLSLEMPLYLGGAIGHAKRESAAQWMAQRAALTAEKRQLLRDITSQHDQVLTDIRRVKAQHKSVASNTSALEATQAGYVAGIRNIVDVLVAQQQLFTAERNYAKSRYDYIKRILALRGRAGALDRKALEKLNRWLEHPKDTKSTR